MPGYRAMLAVPLNPDEFPTVTDDTWAMQPKVDGHRQLVATGPEGAVGYNRDGRRNVLPATIRDVMSTVTTVGLFDSELHQGRLHLFDVPFYGGAVGPDDPWSDRMVELERFLDEWSPPGDVLTVVPHVVDTAEKMDLLAEVTESGGEGVVFKYRAAPYINGYSRWWRKVKFLDDVDAVVVDTGFNGRNNLVLAMADPTGDITLPGSDIPARLVGRCSALTGDGPSVAVGDVVTVRVGGLGASGRLVEPRSPKIRDDKAARDCTLDQLATLRRIKR